MTTQLPARDDVLRPEIAAPVSEENLDRSLVSGIAWTGGVKAATQALSWLSTLVIARLLSPTDYGISGMAMIFTGLVQIVNEFGLSAAVVQRRDLDDDQIAKLGGLSVLLGALMCAIAVLSAPLVATFFRQPAVRDVVIVLSTTFLTSSFQVLPRSLLTRELRFRTLASIEAAEALTQTVFTLVLAVLGWRYWSLVGGLVMGRLASTALALRFRHHRLAWPRPLASIKDPVWFGGHVAAGSIAWYVFRSADMTVVGKRLGDVALGAYTLGWTIASLPVDRIAALVARATPAIFARVQDDVEALRRYVLTLTEGIALLAIPAAVGLALVAGDFVSVVLGPRWVFAITALRILSLAAIFRSTIPILNQVLIATGQARRSMQGTVGIAIVLPLLFIAGSHWGIGGVAVVWLALFPIASFAFYVRHALATCQVSPMQYLGAMWPAASAALVMTVIVLIVHQSLAQSAPLLRLALEVAAGAMTYAAVVYATQGARILSFVAEFRARR